LVTEKLIDTPEHFHLLTKNQWAAFTENTDTVALAAQYRSNLHEYEKNRRLVPLPYLGKAPKMAEATQAGANKVESITRTAVSELTPKTLFQGEGIVPGKARGIAYRIKNLDDAGAVDWLSSEHILVCGRDGFNEQWRRDWYSLFMVARGLVTVQGAQLHHATQIARECGVPFINLPDFNLDDMPDGIKIEIDGRMGTLIIL
jgi:phosphohistidine swiveling domain-containing protein